MSERLTYADVERLNAKVLAGRIIKSGQKKSHFQDRIAISDTKQSECEKTLEVGGRGEAQGSRLLHVCFTLHREQLLDVDAKYSSTKDLLDFLATCGIIPGDREDQITLEVNQIKSKDEKTVIEIYE